MGHRQMTTHPPQTFDVLWGDNTLTFEANVYDDAPLLDPEDHALTDLSPAWAFIIVSFG